MSAIPSTLQMLEIEEKRRAKSPKPEASTLDIIEAEEMRRKEELIPQPQFQQAQEIMQQDYLGGDLVMGAGDDERIVISEDKLSGDEYAKKFEGHRRNAIDALNEADPWKLIPVVGSVKEGFELYGIWDASKRFEAGTATDEDNDLLQEFLTSQKERKTETVGAMTVDLLAGLPPFIIEFILTGGIYTAAKEGTKKGVKKLLGKAIKGSVEKTLAARFATETAGIAAGAAARTVAMPHRIVAEMIRRTLPEIGEDEAGNLAVRFKNEGDNSEFLSAISGHFGEGLADTYIEMFSEQLGGTVKIPGMEKLKIAIFQKWLKINPNNTVAKFTKKLAKGGGWHGVAGEIFEEEIAKGMRAIPYGVDDDGRLKQLQAYQLTTGKELLAMIGAFSVPGAASAGLQAFSPKQTPPTDQEQPLAPQAPDTPPAATEIPVSETTDKIIPVQEKPVSEAELARETEQPLTKEQIDAEEIHEDGGKVRKGKGQEDVRERRQDTEGAEAKGHEHEKREVQVSKGITIQALSRETGTIVETEIATENVQKAYNSERTERGRVMRVLKCLGGAA